ncbi:hypothetical protein VIGAN_10005900 [Vigna angularis var. angularis]|uniref:Uncharacterized protein n=1 Tax=Vigna angularis var. angularis TaxID=157739 RepID=A0A0S3T0Y6_PHAAN|nr:hypothetical protein VIGAN_10005900 [Vigna angularis var. angularis]
MQEGTSRGATPWFDGLHDQHISSSTCHGLHTRCQAVKKQLPSRPLEQQLGGRSSSNSGQLPRSTVYIKQLTHPFHPSTSRPAAAANPPSSFNSIPVLERQQRSSRGRQTSMQLEEKTRNPVAVERKWCSYRIHLESKTSQLLSVQHLQPQPAAALTQKRSALTVTSSRNTLEGEVSRLGDVTRTTTHGFVAWLVRGVGDEKSKGQNIMELRSGYMMEKKSLDV